MAYNVNGTDILTINYDLSIIDRITCKVTSLDGTYTYEGEFNGDLKSFQTYILPKFKEWAN